MSKPLTKAEREAERRRAILVVRGPSPSVDRREAKATLALLADLDAKDAALADLESATRRLLEYHSLSTKDICVDCGAGEGVDVRAFENHSPECTFREVWRHVRRAAEALGGE